MMSVCVCVVVEVLLLPWEANAIANLQNASGCEAGHEGAAALYYSRARAFITLKNKSDFAMSQGTIMSVSINNGSFQL